METNSGQVLRMATLIPRNATEAMLARFGFFVVAFGRNLPSVAVNLFANLIQFIDIL